MIALVGLPEGRYLGAGAIARRIRARPNYLGKLLQVLAREGLLVSQKGQRGGYRLARPPETIRLIEVLDPIESPARLPGCFLGRKECSDDDPCLVHDRWMAVKDLYLSFLSDLTVAELSQHPGAETSLGEVFSDPNSATGMDS
jgi:Rrf2 family protein